MNKAYDLLKKCMELHFAAVEIRLYLDTHPNDQKAQCQFRKVTYECMMLRPQVEYYFGPLTDYGYSQQDQARWVEEPWPWELDY